MLTPNTAPFCFLGLFAILLLPGCDALSGSMDIGTITDGGGDDDDSMAGDDDDTAPADDDDSVAVSPWEGDYGGRVMLMEMGGEDGWDGGGGGGGEGFEIEGSFHGER
jgi:hypothetical protein